MPANATYVIDSGKTFTQLLLMSSGAKTKFGSQDQDVSANGEKKWAVECAATYRTEPGRRPVSEVITVTVTGPASDPAEGIAPGSPVVLDGLRVGISAPESGESGRIRGGRPWFQADGLRQAQPAFRGKEGQAA